MGTEVTEEDLTNINTLAERVIELTEYRASLAEYLKLRMSAEKYERKAADTKSGTARYNKDADVVEEPKKKKKREADDGAEEEAPKKKKKEKREETEEEEP